MSEKDIKQQVKETIEESHHGLSKEDPKLDFKRQWCKLTDSKGIHEFLKDTNAIANTTGGDGFVVRWAHIKR